MGDNLRVGYILRFVRALALVVTVKLKFRQFTVIQISHCKVIRNTGLAVPIFELAWCTKKYFRKGDSGTLSMNMDMFKNKLHILGHQENGKNQFLLVYIPPSHLIFLKISCHMKNIKF